MTKRIFSIGILLATCSIVAYLFRSEVFPDPVLGLVEYRYRWGSIYEARVEVANGGSFNYIGRYDLMKHVRGIYDLPKEFWEDHNADGFYEIHAFYLGDILQEVEVDSDGNHEYDQFYHGPDAWDFFASKVIINSSLKVTRR